MENSTLVSNDSVSDSLPSPVLRGALGITYPSSGSFPVSENFLRHLAVAASRVGRDQRALVPVGRVVRMLVSVDPPAETVLRVVGRVVALRLLDTTVLRMVTAADSRQLGVLELLKTVSPAGCRLGVGVLQRGDTEATFGLRTTVDSTGEDGADRSARPVIGAPVLDHLEDACVLSHCLLPLRRCG